MLTSHTPYFCTGGASVPLREISSTSIYVFNGLEAQCQKRSVTILPPRQRKPHMGLWKFYTVTLTIQRPDLAGGGQIRGFVSLLFLR